MQNKLIDRIRKEQQEYHSNLAKHTPEFIIRQSYETCWKDEFACAIETALLDDNTISALLKLPNILEELYCRWLDTDVQISEIVLDIIEDVGR